MIIRPGLYRSPVFKTESADVSDERTSIDSLADPAEIVDRADVEVSEDRREFPRETYEALGERYERIDGVVMIGLTREDGTVLLQTYDESDGWHPPGGNVDPGRDWVAAARECMEDLSGIAVEIDRPVLVGRTTFVPDDGEGGSGVVAESVLFSASPAEPAPEFETDPTVPDDLDHPLYGDGTEIGLEFEWFESVPEDADPDHEDEIRLLVE